MSLKIDAAELETIADLLRDFSVDPDLTPKEVYEIIWTRFNTLEQTPPYKLLVDQNRTLDVDKRQIYSRLPLELHEFLFDDLFSFAGKYRRTSDPSNGRIYFGKQHAQRRRPKFKGDRPEHIEKGVQVALNYLIEEKEDHIYNTIRFYQKFVNVHPFYDANGRIGRLIASLYLKNNGWVMNWSEFDSKNKFIKKLNTCHNNPSEENFGYLINYVRPFLISLDSLER